MQRMYVAQSAVLVTRSKFSIIPIKPHFVLLQYLTISENTSFLSPS